MTCDYRNTVTLEEQKTSINEEPLFSVISNWLQTSTNDVKPTDASVTYIFLLHRGVSTLNTNRNQTISHIKWTISANFPAQYVNEHPRSHKAWPLLGIQHCMVVWSKKESMESVVGTSNYYIAHIILLLFATMDKRIKHFGFLADRTNGRAIGTVLRPSSSSSVTLCIVAKRCVLEQKLLLRAYRKSYIRNRLVSKSMTLTFV